jgi:hypothetical protein
MFIAQGQFTRPSLQRLASEIDSHGWQPELRGADEEPTPRRVLFKTLDHESVALMELDVDARELAMGRLNHRGAPIRARPDVIKQGGRSRY